MNRHVTQPPPQISRSAFSTAAVAPACSAGNCDHVHAVSNVSTMTRHRHEGITSIRARAGTSCATRRPIRRAARSPGSLRDALRGVPPWSRQISTARSIHVSTGWSADSKPSTSSAVRR